MADKSFWHNKKDKVWFQNFWYYYKVHIFAGLFVLALVGFGLYQCATRVTPDLTICYIGDLYFEDDLVDKMESSFSQYIADADGKDGAVVRFKQINLSANALEMQQAAMLEAATGETQLFVTNKANFDTYANEGIYENIAADLGQTGEVYGAVLDSQKFLQNIDVPEDITAFYGGVRVMIEADADKQDEIIRQQNAKAVLLELAK